MISKKNNAKFSFRPCIKVNHKYKDIREFYTIRYARKQYKDNNDLMQFSCADVHQNELNENIQTCLKFLCNGQKRLYVASSSNHKYDNL